MHFIRKSSIKKIYIIKINKHAVVNYKIKQIFKKQTNIYQKIPTFKNICKCLTIIFELDR